MRPDSTIPIHRFCPQCALETGPEATLCPHCGGKTQGQGYCPICERFWRAAVGSDCPKHEVRLEEGPAPVEDVEPGEWVTIGTYKNETLCEPSRVRLEAEGIPTFVLGSRMASGSMYNVATGGLKLQVPEALAADARVVLAQSWSAVPDDDDTEDAWDDLGPEPGAFRRRVMKGVIVFILLSPLIVALFVALIQRLG